MINHRKSKQHSHKKRKKNKKNLSNKEYLNAIEMENFLSSEKEIIPSVDDLELDVLNIPGFFQPFFENNEPPIVLAKQILQSVKLLTENWNYQEIYVTCLANHDLAKKIELAYQNGERITDAMPMCNHYQEKVMVEIEKLLETEEYKLLRSFYIAPISVYEDIDEQVKEITVNLQLEKLEQKLEKGHAVFFLVDQTNWSLKNFFSHKNDKKIFSSALNILIQKKLCDYFHQFPIPEEIKESFALREDLKKTILAFYEKIHIENEDDAADKSVLNQKKEIDYFFSSLQNIRLLKTWPFNLKYSERILDQDTLIQALTFRQKQHIILNLISKISSANNLTVEQKQAIVRVVFRGEHANISKECQILADNYVHKLNKYLLEHNTLKIEVSNDFASEGNRFKLAKALRLALIKLACPDKNQTMLDFFEVIESAESYARQLRGSHSQLQHILNDMVWEAHFIRKNYQIFAESLLSEKTFLDNEQLFETHDEENSLGLLNHTSFNKYFRTSDNTVKVRILKNYLIKEIEKTYPSSMTPTCGSMFMHSKIRSANRIKKIKTNDLDKFWLILLAELKGQETSFSSLDSITFALKKVTSLLQTEVPAPSFSRIRRFTLFHASQLLGYVNQCERSLRYKWGFSINNINTNEPIHKLGELAHALVISDTLHALHQVILDAVSFKHTLFTNSLTQDVKSNPNEGYKISQDKDSYLASILDALAEDFKHTFQFHPVALEQPIDLVWQEAFGDNEYMQEKFKDTLRVHQCSKFQNAVKANIDVLMCSNIRDEIQTYFDDVKLEWVENNEDVLLNEDTINPSFYAVIQAYMEKKRYKSIKILSFNEMLDLFIKTDALSNCRGKINLTQREEILMSHLSKRIRNVTIFTKKPAHNITHDVMIKDDEHFQSDLYYVNGSFLPHVSQHDQEKEYLNLTFDVKQSMRKKLKSLLVSRILPCLADANVNHPDGFVLMTSSIVGNIEDTKDAKLMKKHFPFILQQMINENYTILNKLKGVFHTINADEGHGNLTYLNHNIPYIQIKKKNGLNQILNEEVYQSLSPILQANLKKCFTVILILENSFSCLLTKHKTLSDQETDIFHHSNVWSKLTKYAGEFDDQKKQFVPTSKEFKTWDSMIKTFNITLNVGEIITLRNRIKPELVLQKRCYDLLKQSSFSSSPKNSVNRHASMCALADALFVSRFVANQELGRAIREKIGSPYLEKMRRRFPAIYQANFCLAKLDEVKTSSEEWKEKIERELLNFIKREKHDLPTLYNLCFEFSEEIKEEEKSKRMFFFFARESYLRTFLEEFSLKLKRNYLMQISNQSKWRATSSL